MWKDTHERENIKTDKNYMYVSMYNSLSGSIYIYSVNFNTGYL